MDEFVAAKLAEWNMTSLQSVFEHHQIDQESLMLLDQATVRELVEPIGPRTKLWKRIQELQSEQERFQQELHNTLWPIPVNIETSQGSQHSVGYSPAGPVNTVVVLTDDTRQAAGSAAGPTVHATPTGTLVGNGKFLSMEQAFELMLRGEPNGHTVAPGAKENVYFLLSSHRTELEAFRKDEYGLWKTSSVKRHHYIVDEDLNLQHVDVRDGLYYGHRKSPKEGTPLDPQPDPDSIMINLRRYMTLRSDRTFRKRISTVPRCPDHMTRMKRLAIVEYTRVYPNKAGENSPLDDARVEDDIKVDGAPIPGAMRGDGSFISMKKVVETMSTCEPSGTVSPRGIKEDVYFLIDNSENIRRQQNNRIALYPDDCGTWGDSSAKTHHYILEGEKLRYVELKDGLYTTGRVPVPVEPQPSFSSVLTCRKYYQTCKRDKNYKKRITTILHCPEHLDKVKHLSVMEYIGAYPGPSLPHGNTKESTKAYIRRTPAKRRLPEYQY